MSFNKLTAKQARFIEEYLVDLNATQAAIRSGYSKKTAGAIGEQNLKKLEIKAALQVEMDKRAKRTGITADDILQFWANIALTPITEYYDQGPDGALVPKAIADMSPAAIQALQSVSYHCDSEGNGRVSFSKLDAMKASEHAAKHLGMFIGKPGDFEKYDDDQLETIISLRTARLGSRNAGTGAQGGKNKVDTVRRVH